MRSSGRGIAGEWLSILRELGERPDFAYGRVTPDGSVTAWFDFQHEDGDGAGTFTQHLLKLGYDVNPTPPVARFRRPRGWKMFRAVMTKSVKGDPRVPWKGFDVTAAPPLPRAPVMLLTVEQTQTLKEIARSKSASLNSLLLHALNDAVAPLLADPSRPRRWLIPVNLRGADGEPNEGGNHASFVGVRIDPGITPGDVHFAIRKQLASNVHWANWWRIRTILRLGRRVTRHLLRKARRKPRYWTGNFSNMGEWNPVTVPPGEEDVAWSAAPPVFSDVALSSVVIVWRGQVCATLMVHPGIKDAPAKAQATIARWRELLLSAGRDGAGSAPYASGPSMISSEHAAPLTDPRP